ASTTSAAEQLPVSMTIRYVAAASYPFAPVEVAFLLSKDVTASSDDLFLQKSFFGSAQPGTDFTFQTQVGPFVAPPDNYFLLARVDPDGTVTEQNEANNVVVAGPITIFRVGDDHPDTPGTTQLPRDLLRGDSTLATGTLGHPEDVDVFKLVVTGRGTLRIGCRSVSGPQGSAPTLRFSLLDSTFRRIGSEGFAYGFSGTTFQSRVSVLAAGSYFVRVQADQPANTGTYELQAEADQPDLRITRLEAPATHSNSLAVPVTYSVSLETSVAQGSSEFTSLQFYLSRDSELETEFDTLVGSSSLSVPRNGTVTSTSFFSTSRTGTYRLLARVDSSNSLTESNEGNNVFVGPLITLVGPPGVGAAQPQPPRADVILGPIVASPDPVSPFQEVVLNGSARFEATTGPEFLGTAVSVYLSTDRGLERFPNDSDPQVASESITVGRGQNTPFALRFMMPLRPPGSYFLIARMEPGNRVLDSNPLNDVALDSLTVGRTGIDLSIDALQLLTTRVAQYSYLPVEVTVRLDAPGVVDAVDTQVGLKLIPVGGGTETTLGSQNLRVGPGMPTTAALSFYAYSNSPAGRYTVTATIDDRNTLAETNERNNTRVSLQQLELGGGGGSAVAPGGVTPTADFALLDFSVPVTNTAPNTCLPVTGTLDYRDVGSGYRNASIRYFASTDTMLDPGDRELQSNSVYVQANTTTTFNHSFTWPDNLTSGTYFIFAQVNRSQDPVETDSSDNVGRSVGAIVVEPTLQDLQVLGVIPDVASFAHVESPRVNFLVSLSSPSADCYSYRYTQVRAFLSKDAVLQPAVDFLVGSGSVGLYSGTTQRTSLTLSATAGVPPDSYFVLVEVDGPNEVRETNETNNVASSQSPVTLEAPQINLSVLDARPLPSGAGVSGMLPVSVTVLYEAPSTAYPNLSPTLLILLSRDLTPDQDDPRLMSRTLFGLAPGEMRSLHAEVSLPTNPAPPPGGYLLAGVIDSDRNFVEKDEKDNVRFSRPALPSASDLPDLVVDSVRPDLPRTSVAEGLGVTVAVRYAGASGYPLIIAPLQLRASSSGVLRADDPVLQASAVILQPLETRVIRLDTSRPILQPPGVYTITGRIDPAGDIAESNELNNVKSGGTVELFRVTDDHPDTPAAAEFGRDGVPADGSFIRAELGHPGDKDVFLLQLPAGVHLIPRLISLGANVRARLLEPDGRKELAASLDSLYRPLRILSPGTYYIVVEGSEPRTTGSYGIRVLADRADLVIRSLEAPQEISLSQQLRVRAEAEVLAHPAAGSLEMDVTFFLSPDDKLDSGLFDFRLGTLFSSGEPGTPMVVDGTFRLSNQVPPGDYFVIGRIGAAQNLAELDTTNNIFVGPKLRVQLATLDLSMGPLFASPSVVSARQMVFLTSDILVDKPSPELFDQFEIELYLSSDQTLDESRDRRLFGHGTYVYLSNPGPRFPFGTDLVLPDDTKPGPYFVFAKMRPNVLQRDLTNDVSLAPAALTVTEPALDLSVASMSVASTTLDVERNVQVDLQLLYQVPVAGEFAQLDNVQVSFWLSDNFTLDPSDRLVGQRSFSLQPGLSNPFSTSLQVSPREILAGEYFLIAEVDPRHTVREKDETNNTLGTFAPTLTVPAATADVSLDSFRLLATAASVQCGTLATFTVSYTPTAGDSRSAPVGVDVYLSSDATLNIQQDALVGSGGAIVAPGGRAGGTVGIFRPQDVRPQDRVQPGGNASAGEIEESGDVDVFSLDVDTAGTYSIDVRLGTLGDSTLTVLDRDGLTQLAYNDDFGSTLASHLEYRFQDPGRYYLVVRGYSSHTGTYSLEARKGTLFKAASAGSGTPPAKSEKDSPAAKGTSQPAAAKERDDHPDSVATFFSPVPVGEYHVFAVATVSGDPLETSTINNRQRATDKLTLGNEPVDLQAVAVEPIDSSVAAGESFVATAVVRAVGGTGGCRGIPVQARIYLSADRLLETLVDYEAETISDSVAPDSLRGEQGTIDVPAGVPSGSYFLLMMLDPRRQAPDSNRANNFAASVGTIRVGSPRTDVSVEQVQSTTAIVAPGDVLQVTAVAFYDAPSVRFQARYQTLKFYVTASKGSAAILDTPILQSSFAVYLEPGKRETFQADIVLNRFLPPGDYFLAAEAVADSRDVNPTNNVLYATKPIRVLAPAFDLEVTSVKPVSVPSFAGSTFTAQVGVRFQGPQAKAAEEELQGKHPFGPPLTIQAQVETFLSPAKTFDRLAVTRLSSRFESLRIGETRIVDFSCTVPQAMREGSYFLGATVDRSNQYPEKNKRNNVLISATSFAITTPSRTVSLEALELLTATVAVGAAVPVSMSVKFTTPATGLAPLIVNVESYLSDNATLEPATDRYAGLQAFSVPPGGVSSRQVFLFPNVPPATYTLVSRAFPQGGNAATESSLRVAATALSIESGTNRPPQVNAGRDRVVAVGRAITLSPRTISDPDFETTTAEWEQIQGPVQALSRTTSHQVRFPITAAGAYTFQLRATDARGMSATDLVTVSARPESELTPILDVEVGGVSGSNSSGDGTIATAYFLDRPRDVAPDSFGNLYILSNGYGSYDSAAGSSSGLASRVVKLERSSGKVFAVVNRQRLAGSSLAGGIGLDARLDNASGIGLHGSDLYIADSGNHRVLKLSVSTGLITTFAGSPSDSPFGHGGYGGDGGPATAALLDGPTDVVATSDGRVFIADSGNNRIRVVDATGTIRTFAGTGQAGFAGDGKGAEDAMFRRLSFLALDRGGGLLVSDTGNGRVRRIELASGLVTTLAGSDPGLGVVAGTLRAPTGVAVDAGGTVAIADQQDHAVFKLAPGAAGAQRITGRAVSGDFGNAGNVLPGELSSPAGLAFDAQGDLFIADEGNGQVRRLGAGTVREAQGAPIIVTAQSRKLPPITDGADTDLGQAGIQATILYEGLGGAFDELELVVWTLNGTDIVRRGLRDPGSSGRLLFEGVTLRNDVPQLLMLRRVSDGEILLRTELSPGGEPIARISLRAVDLGGPQVVGLDARQSFNPTPATALRYTWTLTPPGQTVGSVISTQAVTAFRAQLAGPYVIELVVTDVSDRTSTDERAVRITNVAPRADAGFDQSFVMPDASNVFAGRTATRFFLDGRASSDANDETLSYTWTMLRKPRFSTYTDASIGDAFAAFTSVDLTTATTGDGSNRLLDAGVYVFQLTVKDPVGNSDSKLVKIEAIDPGNLLPRANAGFNQVVTVRVESEGPPLVLAATIPDPEDATKRNRFIRLDGRRSHDPKGNKLSYRWSVAKSTEGQLLVPAGSQISGLVSSDTALPNFTPDVPGTYAFELIVSNGFNSSPPARVLLTVGRSAENFPPVAVAVIRNASDGLSRPGQRPSTLVAEVDTVVLDGRFSYDREDIFNVTYSWSQTRGSAVALFPDSTSSTASFDPIEAGVYEFELVCADTKGAKSNPAIAKALVVVEGRRLPILRLSSSQGSATGGDVLDELKEGASGSLQASTTAGAVSLTAEVNDPDGAGLQRTFSFSQLSGPTVALPTDVSLTLGLTSTVSFTPTTAGVLEFQGSMQEASSAGELTGVQLSRRIRVIVNAPGNNVPTVSIPGGKRKVNVPSLCSPITLTALGADADPNSVLNFIWSNAEAPDVVLSSPYASITTCVLPDTGGDSPRSFFVSVTADDGSNQSEPAILELIADPTAQDKHELPLRRGLDLVSVPLTPRASGSYTSAELAAATSASVVIGLENSAGDGTSSFQVYHADLGMTPFSITGNTSYLILRRKPAVTLDFAGTRWSGQGLQRSLVRGLNLVAYPRGVPPTETAESLRARAGASFVTELDPETGAFRVYVKDLTPAFPIRAGRGYMLSVPGSTTLTLPTCNE
ncbi:MAG: hypothetical protein HYY25_01745, partial [Candidatus Wallbacteria bacterium]|nr:hypothetical protein [Candidatus Wallbacteria bacterium]